MIDSIRGLAIRWLGYFPGLVLHAATAGAALADHLRALWSRALAGGPAAIDGLQLADERDTGMRTRSIGAARPRPPQSERLTVPAAPHDGVRK